MMSAPPRVRTGGPGGDHAASGGIASTPPGRRFPASEWAPRDKDDDSAITDLPLLTADDLRTRSPSRLAGMTEAAETRCRDQACELIRVVANKLRLPLPTTLAALTIILRFYQRRSYGDYSPQLVVPTCLYVASKLEETPKRISDIVNVTHRVLYPWPGDTVELLRVLPPVKLKPSSNTSSNTSDGDDLAPNAKGGWYFPNLDVRLADQAVATSFDRNLRIQGGRTPRDPDREFPSAIDRANDSAELNDKPFGGVGGAYWSQRADDDERVVRLKSAEDTSPSLRCLTGEPYYRVKEIVLELEAEVLAGVGYSLETPQPHRVLLNLCGQAGCGVGRAQLAASVLTDACFRTTMLLRRSAGDLAAGALRCAQAFYGERDVHTAAGLIPPRKVQVDGVDEFERVDGWMRVLGFDAKIVESVAGEMMAVLEAETPPVPVVVAGGPV